MSEISDYLSKNYLLISLISIAMIIIILIIVSISSKKSEGLKPWDTFDARFQQKRDDSGIGASDAGDSMREKTLDAWATEGLTGTGYSGPEFDLGIPKEELKIKEETDIERTENALEYNLHGY